MILAILKGVPKGTPFLFAKKARLYVPLNVVSNIKSWYRRVNFIEVCI